MTTPQQQKSAEQILMGGSGGPPDAFKRHNRAVPISAGTVVGGIVQSWESAQQTKRDDLGNYVPQTWPDGNHKMELRVTVQTDLREARYDDDNGERRFFVKESSNLQRAVRDALVTAGVTFIERGGKLTVRHDGPDLQWQGDAQKNPPNLYTVWYTPAAQLMVNAGQAPAAAAPASGPAPEPTPAASAPQTAAQPAVSATQSAPDATAAAVANLAAAGMTAPAEDWMAGLAPGLVAKLTPLGPAQRAGILALTPEQRAAIGFGDA